MSVLDKMPALVGIAFKGVFRDATLMRDAPGTDDVDPTIGAAKSYACRALIISYPQRYTLQGLVADTERQTMILASTLAVQPQAGDRIVVGGETAVIIAVDADPAKAVWTCRSKV